MLNCGFFLTESSNVGELVSNSCEIFGTNMKGLKTDLEEKVLSLVCGDIKIFSRKKNIQHYSKSSKIPFTFY